MALADKNIKSEKYGCVVATTSVCVTEEGKTDEFGIPKRV